MTQPAPETLEREREKLYVTDAELMRRLGVSGPLGRGILDRLARTEGFPQKQKSFGNRRYMPAVLAFLDRMNRIRGRSQGGRHD